ncbi:fatty acid synthase-like [Anticarsia gemmatalis]|uniref:fatty acid synthase-like n=1 Tax=Anticarsia gemmatalis TaxID=129554 RepID=UPI003F766A0D
MTPTPQDMTAVPQEMVTTTSPVHPAPRDDPNRIVISGMSGLFPRSHNVQELSDILYNKINPNDGTDSRFTYSHPELGQCAGNIPDIKMFDAQFFKVNNRLAESMDPMSRKLLEQTYQAIYDAGVNPTELAGKKVGVYVGSCFSESEKSLFYVLEKTGLGIMGCSKTMFANRVSYWLDTKGPSLSIDEACLSSARALEQACAAINRGDCESAVVGGSYIGLHPHYYVHFGRVIQLSKDGKTKTFDENAEGCAKSEAINVLFLQKAKDARRIYADVLHAKTEFVGVVEGETGPQYGFYRKLNDSLSFMKTFYDEARISPDAVEYVEAFGSASHRADKDELQAIEEIFCKNREEPLLVGSVMSNIGYGEAASTISAITKVLLGYHHGLIAGNLNCDNPRKDIPALAEGRMRILTDHERTRRSYAAVNGLSITGVNAHVLLHGHYKPKDLNRYKTSLPYLVTLSGRQEAAVAYAFNELKSKPIDPEQIALLHKIHSTSILGHLGRGFIILKSDENQNTVTLCERAEYFNDVRRPLWFVYSGMGSQWPGMGTQLMAIPTFAAAIQKCNEVLSPLGIDIVDVITNPDKKTFDNILNSFMGIAAVQIGLTDVLRELGLVPDGIIGHSVGELGCAYADGCLTAQEMILAAYSRGKVSLETKFIRGSMAAVGLGYEQVSKLCPPDIEVACHNGPESSTISGPAESMREFVAKLTSQGIFAKEVPCSNIAYHSRYIADAGPGLLSLLKKAIPNPKPRSSRWYSTSVPQSMWDEPMAKTCSAEYLTNNLLSSVLFDETSQLIPPNAVLVEIAPHGLLQAILKRSMPPTCKNIALTKRMSPDSKLLILKAVGELYLDGFNPNVQTLYPTVEMPVSTGTPFLSHLVQWEHSEDWPLMVYASSYKVSAASCNFNVTLHDQENAYLVGNNVRGNILYPYAASLMLVWDTLAMTMGVRKKEVSVQFQNLYLYTQPLLHDRRQLKLSVAIQRASGRFEVLNDNAKIITGVILPSAIKVSMDVEDQTETRHYTADEVYEMLRHRDYEYSGEFRVIESIDKSLSEATLSWRDNWVTFLEGMMQVIALRQPHHAVSVPTFIGTIRVNVKTHNQILNNSNVPGSNSQLNAKYSEQHDVISCGGVTIANFKYQHLPPVSNSTMDLKISKFVSNFENGLDVSDSLEVYTQIVAKNLGKDELNIVEVKDGKVNTSFTRAEQVLNNVYGINVNYKQIAWDALNNNTGVCKDADVVLVQNLSDDNARQTLRHVLKRDQFIISEESFARGTQPTDSVYRVICAHSNEKSDLQLIRWGAPVASTSTIKFTILTDNDIQLLTSAYKNLPSKQRLLVMTPYPASESLMDVIRSWHKNADDVQVKLLEVKNGDHNHLAAEKLTNIELMYNIFQDGRLGGDYYLPANEQPVAVQKLENSETSKSGVTVKICYAGISSIDVKKANDLLVTKDNIDISCDRFGIDFSGLTKSGERVMGIVPCGAASSEVRAAPELLWPVPPHWSLEDAATVPLAYLQAFYCLAIKAKLHAGLNVMVHGGSGALGQAIIAVALAYDCEVFATVSDTRKKHFLQKLFPKLKADHIGCSRDYTFADMVSITSKQKGCDIVVSNVGKDLKDPTMKCVAIGGKLLDISQIHNEDVFMLGMNHLSDEKMYVTVDFTSIFAPENAADLKVIHEMISTGIALGYVRPLSRVTYAPHDAERAFRLVDESRHRGRVLLHMQSDKLKQLSLKCTPEGSHLVVCGQGMFGPQLADRLVERGVKKLHINILNQSPYLQYKLRTWAVSGVEVTLSSEKLNKVTNVVNVLNKAISAGPVEGIYVALDGVTDDVKDNTISSLDSASRQLCPDLRYFAVLNIGNRMVGKDVCAQRASEQLPAAVVRLPEINDNSSVDHWRSAMDAIERAVQTGHNVLFAQTRTEPTPSLFEQIFTRTGLPVVPENIANDVTLQDLGVQSHYLKVIGSYLKVQYNVLLSEDQIASLTVGKISELEKTVTEVPFENIKGLSSFFNYVDPDELKATSDLVLMPTLANQGIEEFDLNLTYLCIVPGMEGHHERFRVLCERLKLPALVLQPGLDFINESFAETAQRYAKVLLKQAGVKKNFYLLGYGSGVFIALELAGILEEHGLNGTVFCIGHGPDEYARVLEEQLSEYKTEDQLADGVLRHMFRLMAGDDTAPLDKALQNVTTWDQKVAVSVRCLLGRVMHSAQYARALIEAGLARIKQARQPTVTVRALNARVVLMRTACDVTPQPTTDLQQYSRHPVEVLQLRAPLGAATADLRCASVVNERLDRHILDYFDTLNTCDSYNLSAYYFVRE